MTSRSRSSQKKIIFHENLGLNNLIAEGGEGRIYDTNDGFIIKIFKDHVDKKSKFEKIEELKRCKLPSEVISPIAFVYNRYNEKIGYMMKKVAGDDMRSLSSKKYVKINGILKKDILEMLVKVKNALKRLHSMKVYIGDLNDMNILFNYDNEVYFIDVDSWSIGSFRCTVANDLFKDPNLVRNYFNSDTDNYSFAVMIYKSITRMHPFCGTLRLNENMSVVDRMSRGISIIDNKNVIIPKEIVDDDSFLSSRLRKDLKSIFDGGERFLVDESLDDMLDNLEFCKTHGDYYYSRYDGCPVCGIDVKERPRIVKIGDVDGIPIKLIFSGNEIKYIIDDDVYIDVNDNIIFRKSMKSMEHTRGCKYHIDSTGEIAYEIGKNAIRVNTPFDPIIIWKKLKTRSILRNDELYYISNNLNLTKFSIVDNRATSEVKISKVSINCVFEVFNRKQYFICSSYDHLKIIDVSGNIFQIIGGNKIVNYGIHFDPILFKWLFIFEDERNTFHTYIFDENKGVVYKNDKIKYSGTLGNMAFHNGFIFKPSDEKIVRFDYRKDEYKDFNIPVVSEASRLIKKRKKIIIINEKEIYEVG